MREKVDETVIAEALALGAQDAVTLGNVPRLQLVVGRELRTYRLDRALSSTLASAREAKKQLQHIVEGSTDAIALVQEGIIVDANPAWLALFGYSNPEEVVGTPLMDAFDPDDHAAIKGALVACMQGKWSGHTLHASALVVSGHHPSLEFQLVRAEFDGEPCVQVVVPARVADAGEYERKLEEALQSDPATGFLHRRNFVEKLRARLAEPAKGGVRCMAYVEPDKYDALHEELGVLMAEDFLSDFARAAARAAAAGRPRRPFRRPRVHAAGRARQHAGRRGLVRARRAQGRDRGLPGGREIDVDDLHHRPRPGAGRGQVRPRARRTTRTRRTARAARSGGNRVQLLEHTGMMLRLQDQDRLWVKQIKAALMENRFRLVQQPIASLVGEDLGMFDVLVRMLDEQGQEVLPSVFMPAAERNDLMKNVDRWVIGAAMSFCAARKPGALFVRLSQDTLADASLPAWLAEQLKKTKIEPARIVFQVREEAVAQQVKDAVALHKVLTDRGFRFAIEGFGMGRDTERLLKHLKPDFVKIHGALMQGLSADQDKQARVKSVVELARKCKAVTIGERVQDANTMAVLWQLGVEFIQGYFVNAPEEVVLG